MDIFERDHGATTAETVHRREEFRHIVADVQELPETQRTALLLREIDALSYDQIAEAMDTTVPSVKSLLVRARVGLAEAAEARLLTCEEVRLELGQVAEGLAKTSAPVRRHLKSCERCRIFRTQLRHTSKALAAVFPIGALAIVKKLGLAKLTFGGGAAAGSAAAGGGGVAAGGAGLAAGGAATAASSAAAGGAISAGIGAVASKAAAGMAAAVIVTAGAVEVKQVAKSDPAPTQAVSAAPPGPVQNQPVDVIKPKPATKPKAKPATEPKPEPEPAVATPPPAPALPAATPVPAAAPVTPPVAPVQEEESVAKLPPRTQPVTPPIDDPVTDPAPEDELPPVPVDGAPEPVTPPPGPSGPPSSLPAAP
jgi:hypothetical protein